MLLLRVAPNVTLSLLYRGAQRNVRSSDKKSPYEFRHKSLVQCQEKKMWTSCVSLMMVPCRLSALTFDFQLQEMNVNIACKELRRCVCFIMEEKFRFLYAAIRKSKLGQKEELYL